MIVCIGEIFYEMSLKSPFKYTYWDGMIAKTCLVIGYLGGIIDIFLSDIMLKKVSSFKKLKSLNYQKIRYLIISLMVGLFIFKYILVLIGEIVNKSELSKIKQEGHGTFIDFRDLNTYKAVKVGNQIWLAENLNFYVPNPFFFLEPEIYRTFKFAMFSNDSLNLGRLYRWDAVNRAIPIGWRLPSNDEWKSLIDSANFLGGLSSLGFEIKMAGYYDFQYSKKSRFKQEGYKAHFWTSTQYSNPLLAYSVSFSPAGEGNYYGLDYKNTIAFSALAVIDFHIKNSMVFKVTKEKYTQNDDLDKAVSKEFGSSYNVADWDDIIEYCDNNSPSEFIEKLGWESGDENSLIVTAGGKRFLQFGSQQYFVSRHDHELPSHYFSHANIDKHLIDLGAWSITGNILCKKLLPANYTKGWGDPILKDQLIKKIDFNSNNDMFILRQGELSMSSDEGKTWNTYSNNYKIRETTSDFLIDSKNDIFRLQAAYWLEKVYSLEKSIDNGKNWKSLRVSRKVIIGPLMYSANEIFIGENNVIGSDTAFVLRSINGGINWHRVSFFPSPNYNISFFTLDPRGNIYMIGREYSVSGKDNINLLYTSDNHGKSWVKSILPTEFHQIVFSKDDYAFGATSEGVYYSTNQGQSWELRGLRGSEITSIAINQIGLIFIGTSKGTLYCSNDDGITWERSGSFGGFLASIFFF